MSNNRISRGLLQTKSKDQLVELCLELEFKRKRGWTSFSLQNSALEHRMLKMELKALRVNQFL